MVSTSAGYNVSGLTHSKNIAGSEYYLSVLPSRLLLKTRSHPQMVGDTSHVTLNFDLSKIPFVRF